PHCPAGGVPLEARVPLAQRGGHHRAGAGPEKAAGGRLEPLADRDHLIQRFALAEHHLRLPLAQGAVMVDAGEREVLEGEMPQTIERGVGRETAGGDVGQQGLELLGSHATAATGSRYSRKIASASAIDSIWNR